MKKRSNFSFLQLFLLTLIFISCASGPDIETRNFAKTGDYQSAIYLIEENINRFYNNSNEVLYYLDKGLLEHYSGLHEESFNSLTKAENYIFDLYSKSITKKIGSLLINDNVTDYAGEDYEDIYINIFKALNFINQGNIESAFVEIRRFDNKQKELSTKYSALLAEGKESVKKNRAEQRDSSVEFHNSALARYISMLLYRSEGDMDSARIDRQYIDSAFEKQPSIYNFSQPKNLDNELQVPDNMARLNIVSFSGLAPIKEAKTERFFYYDTNDKLNYIKIELPYMVKQTSMVNKIQVLVDKADGTPVTDFILSPLESISNIAVDTFNQVQSIIYFRSITRALSKTAAREVVNVAYEEIGSDSTLGLFLGITSLVMNVTNKVTESADIRISKFFPSLASVGGVNLVPGVYNIRVNYYTSGSSLIKSEEFLNINVDKDKLNLLEAVCLK